MRGEISHCVSNGLAWKQYPAGGPYNLLSDGPNRSTCARLVVMLTPGDLTTCRLPDGTNSPLTGLPAGYQHPGATSEITPTAGCVVYW